MIATANLRQQKEMVCAVVCGSIPSRKQASFGIPGRVLIVIAVLPSDRVSFRVVFLLARNIVLVAA